MKLEQEIEYSYFNDNEYDKMSLKPDALIFENESINNASKKYDKMVSDVFFGNIALILMKQNTSLI